MTPLSRYVLRQHLGPFLFGFFLILFVLVLDLVLQMMDQVLSKGLSIGLAGRVFLYNLAWIIALTVPMAVLIAVLMVFGRMAADSEIMAAKSCGIGFLTLLRPVLVAAFLLFLVMVVFNDQVLPDWNHQARNISANLKRRKATVVLKEKAGVFIRDLGAYSLLVRQVDEQANRLHGITVYDASQPGPPTVLRAPEGEIHIFEDGRYTRLTLYQGEFHRLEPDDPERFVRGTFGRQVIHIEDADRALNPYQSSYRSDREMSIAAMHQAVQEYAGEQQRNQQALDSTRQALAPAAGWPDTAASTHRQLQIQLQKQQNLDTTLTQRIDSYLVEIHKKFSIPFACVVFVLVGAPLGVVVRRRGAAVSVGVSLIFFLAYWMFLIGGEELADRDYISPALSMWAPNLFFGLVGLALLRAIALDHPLWGPRRRTGPPPAQEAR